MGNRKQPFGYAMVNGEIVVQPQEAETVREAFRMYGEGMGFAALAETLNESAAPYYPGKSWNKNMVARLLGDSRYAGEQGFPKIVDREQLETASAQRKSRRSSCEATPAQKALRRLCGCAPPKDVEQQVLWQMNRLIADPGLLRCPVEEAATTHTSQYESKLDAMLSEQPVDDTAAKKLILQLAAAEYEKLSNGEYETQRLRSIFERLSPIRELTAELLTQTISSIEVRRDNGVSIRLKNSQIIRGGIQECRSRKKN